MPGILPVLSRTRRLIEGFLDIVFPRLCLGCGREGEFLCQFCAGALRPVAPVCIGCGLTVPARRRRIAGRTCNSCRKSTAVGVFWSPFRYEEPLVRSIIRAYKYQRVQLMGEAFADIVAEAFERFGLALPPDALLVPIPLTPERERVRGFNQSELFARALGRRLGRPVSSDILVRIRSAPAQVGLHGHDRRLNVAGAFALRRFGATEKMAIVLVDDVKTTGATLNEAARLLRRAGARRVWAITAAH